MVFLDKNMHYNAKKVEIIELNVIFYNTKKNSRKYVRESLYDCFMILTLSWLSYSGYKHFNRSFSLRFPCKIPAKTS